METTIAKGLTSAYAPLSGSIISKRVWSALERGTDENGAIGHGWTYSAHPIGAAAGIANLTPGDFAALARQHRFRRVDSPAALVELLQAECALKGGAKRGIGFLA